MSTVNNEKRDKVVKNIKTGADLIMYIGSAAMTIPAIKKAKENSNSLMGSCAVGTGAMLSLGIGKIASNILNKAIDKTVEFIDDVKPKPKDEEDEEEAE